MSLPALKIIQDYFLNRKQRAKIGSSYNTWEHETIIRTGITCKKTPCYMCDSACRWFIVKKVEVFRSYVKHF